MNTKNIALAIKFNRTQLEQAVLTKNNESVDEIRAKLTQLYIALADLELEKINVQEVA